jgi:HrpA-like RNA helicase
VLVFLPGTREIQDVQEAVLATELGRDPEQRAWVLPLHGSLPPEEQKRVFDHPPRGVVKVVLATNVAETSITIDDVGFVIDSGHLKEERYDPERRMGSLENVLVSKAAAKQRRGRAGRVCEGLCVHLFPSDEPLAAYQEPEVRRVDLQHLVMRTKALRLPGRAVEICAELPEPPSLETVKGAVAELAAIGALTLERGENHEALTPLGELLVKLPVDCRLGKLIVLGLCFGAADETLTIAAALASRSPFMSPMDRREEADRRKKALAGDSQSDHLAVLRAYQRFDSLKGNDRFDFARENFLGIKTLQVSIQSNAEDALDGCPLTLDLGEVTLDVGELTLDVGELILDGCELTLNGCELLETTPGKLL